MGRFVGIASRANRGQGAILMRLAVMSDSHDRLDHLELALDQVRAGGAGALLFCGDFCAPFSLAAMAGGFEGPIHAVFGNNDGDPFLLSRVAAGHPHVTLHGQLAELELDGCRVALNHYPEIARRLAESGAYDAVFSGHDHRIYQHCIGHCLWANPGEVMGRFGRPTFGWFDTEQRRFEHVDLNPGRTGEIAPA